MKTEQISSKFIEELENMEPPEMVWIWSYGNGLAVSEGLDSDRIACSENVNDLHAVLENYRANGARPKPGYRLLRTLITPRQNPWVKFNGYPNIEKVVYPIRDR